MVRSTVISWKIGLVVAALTLPLGQIRAQTDGGLSEKPETSPKSLEPKEVQVILLPPANDNVFTSRRPAILNKAPIIMVQPVKKRSSTELTSEPAEVDEDVTSEKVTSLDLANEEETNENVINKDLAKKDVANENVIKEDVTNGEATVVESPSAPEPPPRVASLPAVNDAIIASPPPLPEKTRKSATPTVIPSLPGRSPFRQTPFKSEIVENRQEDVAALRQQSSEPASRKGNAAIRFLAKLLPGDEEESTRGAPRAEGRTSADAGEADTLVPPTASASTSDEQAGASPKSEKPPIKRLLDGLQFWKK